MILADLAEPAPAPGPADWNDDGVVILKDFLPHSLVTAYEREWWDANDLRTFHLVEDSDAVVIDADRPGGWPDCIPYMRHSGLRALCCYGPLGDILQGLTGEPMGVHLNLSGWTSTERDWHQDTYLNESEVGDYYAAVWMALGDVHPDSGPFQYVPGSHRWHRLVREKIVRYIDPQDPDWPKHTETFLSPLVEKEIANRGAEVMSYIPHRGDVLIWHPRLYHRGSKAIIPGAYRPALIAHYSGIKHRSLMPTAIQDASGGWLFPLGGATGIEGNTGR